MFEYFASTIMSINIMGIGAYPILLAISIGIALLISQKRIGEFILITAIMNLIIGIGLFMASQEGMYLVITAMALIIILLSPGKIDEQQ